MLYTMFPYEETKELKQYIEHNFHAHGLPLLQYNLANHYIKVNMSAVKEVRDRNERLMIRSINDYLKEFNYTI